MCGIVGSFKKEVLLELFEKNKSRGNKAWSLTSLTSPEVTPQGIVKKIGEFKPSYLDNAFIEGNYHILHIQSPTKVTDLTSDKIHPAEYDGNFLWHNGMLLARALKWLQTKYKSKTDWDTALLLKAISPRIFPALDSLEGSFGCLYLSAGEFYIFRNHIIPLYVSDDLDISSTPHEGFKLIEPNTIFKVDFLKKTYYIYDRINNKHNPYAF